MTARDWAVAAVDVAKDLASVQADLIRIAVGKEPTGVLADNPTTTVDADADHDS